MESSVLRFYYFLYQERQKNYGGAFPRVNLGEHESMVY